MKKLLYIGALSLLLLTACGKEAKQKDETPTVEEKNTEIQDNKNNEKINVSLDADIEITPKGLVVIRGKTNLPDNADLMVKLRGKNYHASQSIDVYDGEILTKAFSKSGEALPPGKYILSISLSIAATQRSKDFLKVAGKEYENLTGELMQGSGTKKFLYYEKKFKITK